MRRDRPEKIKAYTLETGTIVFTLQNGDTADTDLYSFYSQGQEVRFVAYDRFSMDQKGDPLIYEDSEFTGLGALRNFALDLYEFDQLDWILCYLVVP